jgi:hypothetical protein
MADSFEQAAFQYRIELTDSLIKPAPPPKHKEHYESEDLSWKILPFHVPIKLKIIVLFIIR